MSKVTLGALALTGLLVLGCGEPSAPNYNDPLAEAGKTDPSAIQLMANGILARMRQSMPDYISDVGIFGRESYEYFPTDQRTTSDYLIVRPISNSGFAAGNWFVYYTNLRNLATFKDVVSGAPALSETEKNAGVGFASTIEALQLSYVLATRDSIGIVVELRADPTSLAPFVTRDSALKHIAKLLDDGYAKLTAGGAAFPFTLSSGFAGFNRPSTFAQFNRALAARIRAYQGSLGCGATCYNQALTALGQSFLSTTGSFDVGPRNVFSSASGDVANVLSNAATKDIVAHPSYEADAQLQPGGAKDQRYLDKIIKMAEARGPTPREIGIATTLDFATYPERSSPIPIILNDELILLRAEARWFTGDKLGAMDDLNLVRTTAGKLAALLLPATDADFVTALLYERRFSLMFEGHRWVDHRRFGRLADLPLDITTGTNAHWVAKVVPIPQSECLARAQQTDPALRGPGC